MDSYSDDDSKKQITTQSSQTWADYLKENKVTVFIILAIAAIAIWYFYFRTDGSSILGSESAPAGASKVNIIRMRGSGAY